MVKYIFFDLGLTLVENHMAEHYQKALAASDICLTKERAEQIYHLANKYFMRERQGSLGKGDRNVFEEYVSYICELAGDASKKDQTIEAMQKMEKPQWKAFSYTHEVLDALKEQGFKMGLISNWDDSCRNVLRDNGLETYLEPIIISSEIGIEKPDKRIFEKALAEAGVKAEECLYVGDNYYDDAVGAAKLGISSFIINPADYFGIEELRDKKVNIISDIREIPCKIREIQKTDKSIV